MNQARQESVERLAYCIWQDRSRRKEVDANDSEKNYYLALKTLYPEEVKDECFNHS